VWQSSTRLGRIPVHYFQLLIRHDLHFYQSCIINCCWAQEHRHESNVSTEVHWNRITVTLSMVYSYVWLKRKKKYNVVHAFNAKRHKHKCSSIRRWNEVTTLLSSSLLESCAHRTDVPELWDEPATTWQFWSCLDLEPPTKQPTELPMFQIAIPLPPPEVYVKPAPVGGRNCAEGAKLSVNKAVKACLL
jgi:hypothetical protein